MIVEFAGLPGSGKTTLLRHLHGKLEEEGIPSVICSSSESLKSVSRFGKLWEMIRIFYTNRKGLESLPFMEIIKMNDLSGIRLLISSLMHTLLYYERCIAEHQGKICLIDEGVVQRIFSLFVFQKKVDGERIESYLASLPSADLVVYLDTDVSTSIGRMQKRGSVPHRMRHMTDKESESLLERGKEVFDRLRMPNMYRLDARQNLEKSSDIIVSLLKERWRRHG